MVEEKKEEKKKEPHKASSKSVIVKSINEKGEPSNVKKFMPILADEASLVKPNGKNRLLVDYPIPRPEKGKFLGLAIKYGNVW